MLPLRFIKVLTPKRAKGIFMGLWSPHTSVLKRTTTGFGMLFRRWKPEAEQDMEYLVFKCDFRPPVFSVRQPRGYTRLRGVCSALSGVSKAGAGQTGRRHYWLLHTDPQTVCGFLFCAITCLPHPCKAGRAFERSCLTLVYVACAVLSRT